jgi:hypothetical protein
MLENGAGKGIEPLFQIEVVEPHVPGNDAEVLSACYARMHKRIDLGPTGSINHNAGFDYFDFQLGWKLRGTFFHSFAG